jgi:hypothetical protein
MVYGYTDSEDGEYFSDGAAVVDIVRLRGRVPVAVPDTELVEGTYISVGATSPTTISGTVTCDEPLIVYIEANTYQTRGRVALQAYGGIEIECDGATSFSIPISGESRVGAAVIFVYGYAYRIVENPEEPFDDFEYVWDDFLVTAARLRR